MTSFKISSRVFELKGTDINKTGRKSLIVMLLLLGLGLLIG